MSNNHSYYFPLGHISFTFRRRIFVSCSSGEICGIDIGITLRVESLRFFGLIIIFAVLRDDHAHLVACGISAVFKFGIRCDLIIFIWCKAREPDTLRRAGDTVARIGEDLLALREVDVVDGAVVGPEGDLVEDFDEPPAFDGLDVVWWRAPLTSRIDERCR